MRYFTIHGFLQRTFGSLYVFCLSFFYDKITVKIMKKAFIYFQNRLTKECVLKIDKDREESYGYFVFNTKEIYLCPRAFQSHFISLIAKKEKNILFKMFYLILFTLFHEYGHFIDSKNSKYSSQLYSSKGLYVNHFVKTYSFLQPEQFVEDHEFVSLLQSAKNSYVDLEMYAEQTASSFFKQLKLNEGLQYCTKEIAFTKDMLERYFTKKQIPKLLQETFKQRCSFSDDQIISIIHSLQMKLI